MTATAARQTALRLSQAREFIHTMIGQDDLARYDVTAMAAEIAEFEGDFEYPTWEEFDAVASRHEYDEHGLTDAALAKALEHSQTGWVAVIRRPDGDVETLTLNKKSDDETEKSVEDTLREFVQFPEGTGIRIFPLVG